MIHLDQPFGGLVVGMLTDIQPGDDVATYLHAIDATLRPFAGRFVIHGGNPEALEGELPDADLIVIGFPSVAAARGWYGSEAYQQLVPLRQGFSRGAVTLFNGEPDEHRAADILSRIGESDVGDRAGS